MTDKIGQKIVIESAKAKTAVYGFYQSDWKLKILGEWFRKMTDNINNINKKSEKLVFKIWERIIFL